MADTNPPAEEPNTFSGLATPSHGPVVYNVSAPLFVPNQPIQFNNPRILNPIPIQPPNFEDIHNALAARNMAARELQRIDNHLRSLSMPASLDYMGRYNGFPTMNLPPLMPPPMPPFMMGRFSNSMTALNMPPSQPLSYYEEPAPIPNIPGFDAKKKPIIVFSPGTGPSNLYLPKVDQKIGYKTFKDRSFKECTFTNCTYDMCIPLKSTTRAMSTQAYQRQYENCDFTGCSFQNCTWKSVENGVNMERTSEMEGTAEMLWGGGGNDNERYQQGAHEGMFNFGRFDGCDERQVEDVYPDKERGQGDEWTKKKDGGSDGGYFYYGDIHQTEAGIIPFGGFDGVDEREDDEALAGDFSAENEIVTIGKEEKGGTTAAKKFIESVTINVPATGGGTTSKSQMENLSIPAEPSLNPVSKSPKSISSMNLAAEGNNSRTPDETQKADVFASQSYGTTSVATAMKAPPGTPSPMEKRPSVLLDTPHGMSPPRKKPAPSPILGRTHPSSSQQFSSHARSDTVDPDESVSQTGSPPVKRTNTASNLSFTERLRRMDENNGKQLKGYIKATKHDKPAGANKTAAWLANETLAPLVRNEKNEEELLREVEVQHLKERKRLAMEKSLRRDATTTTTKKGGKGHKSAAAEGGEMRLSQADTMLYSDENEQHGSSKSGKNMKKEKAVARKEEVKKVKKKDSMMGKIRKTDAPSSLSAKSRTSTASRATTSRTGGLSNDGSKVADDEMGSSKVKGKVKIGSTEDMENIPGDGGGGASEGHKHGKKKHPGYSDPNMNQSAD